MPRRSTTGFLFAASLLLFFAAAPTSVQAQVSSQGFEESSADDWSYTPDYNFDNGSDGSFTVVSNSNPPNPGYFDAHSGTQFWGINDLDDEGDNGTGDFADLTFDGIDVSGLTGVQVSFYYRADGFNSNDTLRHEVIYDGEGQGTVTDLRDATSDGWEQVTIDVPDTVETVGLILSAKQNGGDDFAGWDDAQVTSGTESQPTVQFASSGATVSEGDGSASVEVSISNPDGSESSVEVQFDSGSDSDASSSDIGGFTSETVNFPAGAQDGDTQTVSVPLTDDSETEGSEVANFDLTGATNAQVGSPSSYDLTIQDNDTPNAWVNEIHYDNDGSDTGEFVEIVLEAPGTYDLSNFTVVRYNGSNGELYGTETVNNLSAGNSPDGFTTYTWEPSSLQNGPDGVALCYQGNPVFSGGTQQFLSYEGNFTAADGCASGATSTDIGVSEPSSSPIGESLQLAGDGSGENTTYDDYTWAQPSSKTSGALNDNQEISQTIPVEFAGAPNATVEGSGAVTLRWTTLTETNNAGFYVEHRRAGASGQSSWTTANPDARIDGAGASTSEQRYAYTVRGLAPGAQVFRVRQVDTDGDATFSPVVEVEVGSGGFVLDAPAPNPLRAGQTAQLTFHALEGAEVEAALYNSLGQQVRTLDASGGPRLLVEAEGLSSGLYFVRLTAGERTATQPLTLVR